MSENVQYSELVEAAREIIEHQGHLSINDQRVVPGQVLVSVRRMSKLEIALERFDKAKGGVS